jgi:hypothetical protein
MVVANEKPTQEVLYLGRDVRQVDLWGRTTKPRQENGLNVIDVNRLPTFVTGLDRTVTGWRQSLALDHVRIASIPGIRQQNGLRWTNNSDRQVAGELAMVEPPGWRFEPNRISFRLNSGQSLELPFFVILPNSAAIGTHEIRIDLQVDDHEPSGFSAYRAIDVGLGNLDLDAVSGLNERGELVIQQRLVNHTGENLSFQCHLLTPGRRREGTRIVRLGQGQDVRTYRLPNGIELFGKTVWLRVEEIDGPRMLNYRFVVGESGGL